jgi:hypothetical protein
VRLFFGIIVGIALTLGAAYIYDSVRDTSGGEGSFDRPVVNWDVLGHSVKSLPSALRDGWERMTGRPKDSS